MGVPATPSSSGQKLLKEGNKSKYKLYFNSIKGSINLHKASGSVSFLPVTLYMLSV